MRRMSAGRDARVISTDDFGAVDDGREPSVQGASLRMQCSVFLRPCLQGIHPVKTAVFALHGGHR
jgi:hypothetical protein